MVSKIVKHLVLWGYAYLEKRKIYISDQLLSDRELAIQKLETQAYDLRLSIIQNFDSFFIGLQNTYLVQLSKADDSTKTLMMQHWVENINKIDQQFKTHLNIMVELDRIRKIQNPL